MYPTSGNVLHVSHISNNKYIKLNYNKVMDGHLYLILYRLRVEYPSGN
jgi:hypothetical protein